MGITDKRRCDLFVGYVSLVDRICNEEIHRIAGTSEDVTVRMKKNVLSWFGHVERKGDERMVKKIYDGNVSGRGRPRLTFINTISKILEEGQVKYMRTAQRECIKRLMTVERLMKEICRDRSVWCFDLSKLSYEILWQPYTDYVIL